MREIFKDRPYPKWGFEYELGCSNDKEDKFVINYFADKQTTKILVDIGAADGITGSNSYKLINEFGWNAILVEPLNTFCNYLHKLYSKNNKVQILNYACDVEEKDTTIKYRSFDEAIGLTSLVNDWENCQPIQTKKFENLISNQKIDFLSIDCEGKDLDIIRDIDFIKYDIEIICCERSNNNPYYDQHMISYLMEKKYLLTKITNHNFIFVKK